MSSRSSSSKIERKFTLPDHPAGQVIFRLSVDGPLEGYDDKARDQFAESVLNHMVQNFGLTASVFSQGDRQQDGKTRSYPTMVMAGNTTIIPTIEITNWPTTDRDLYRFAYSLVLAPTVDYIGLTLGHGPTADYLEQSEIRTQATSLQARQTLSLISPEMPLDGQRSHSRQTVIR
jgi:hypothetical protein